MKHKNKKSLKPLSSKKRRKFVIIPKTHHLTPVSPIPGIIPPDPSKTIGVIPPDGPFTEQKGKAKSNLILSASNKKERGKRGGGTHPKSAIKKKM